MNEEKKNSNIDKNFNGIYSALKELEDVCETSFKLFNDVLVDKNIKLSKESDEERSPPSSKLSGRQEDILDRIIVITNKYVDFNKRCDL